MACLLPRWVGRQYRDVIVPTKKPAAPLRALTVLLCLGWVGFAANTPASTVSTNSPARVKISGLGLLGNREMKRLLRNFQADRQMPTTIDRTFVEDAALVLLSRMNNEGYLNTKLQARFRMLEGGRQQFVWTNALEAQLPPDFAAREARFRVRRGVRFHYDSVKIVGAKAIPARDARRYFISGDTLLNPRANRVFSPERLESSLTALHEALARKGYRDAKVTATQIHQDNQSGAVAVEVLVQEGVPSMVRSVTTEVYGPGDTAPLQRATLRPGKPHSRIWQEDFARQLQEHQYARGFPDASVEFSILTSQTNTTSIELDLLARVNTGPQVQLGEVLFQGHRHTRLSVLESRVKLTEGEPLDRLEAEHARQRLARLGVFDRVGLRYANVDDTTRDVVYDLQESKALSVSLLAGYGSYEKLRGGLELEHRNVLGLAHNVRLRGLQSFKATSGDVLYTVPEFFFENLDFFVRGSGLRREEISFTREEYGGAVGVHKRIVPIQTDLAVRYDYEFLNALDVTAMDTNRIGVTEARAAAFVIDLSRDRRDNPLMPRHGLKLFGNIEWASEALGGNVDYQRFIVGGSYHLSLGGGRLLHLGVTHGVTLTLGGDDEQLPFNKRFFPGGENSIRGYQQGEASPLDPDGQPLGAETYTQANVELEQLLTRSWSIVAFFDAVGIARDRRDYPWDEGLYSVGGGIRWRTIIGPVRLEYGHNLNRRQHDPAGTLHLSIGFPF